MIVNKNGTALSSKAGYGSAGASRVKRAFKGFDAVSGDAISDIDAHNQTLRQRSRVLYMAAPLATSALRTNRTNVIGCGLNLKSRLNTEVLGLTSDAAAKLERKIEAEFSLWAGDKFACDATGMNDFNALQQLALMGWLQSGDVFVLKKHREPTSVRPYSLRLMLVEADRISTPLDLTEQSSMTLPVLADGQPLYFNAQTEGVHEGNRIHDGVEVDESGMVVAYHVCSRYPLQGVSYGETPTWERIPVLGEKTDMPNVLHIMDTERPEQYRGVPYLAHVMEPLLQSRRYTESELMAALVESFFTVFVTKSPGDVDAPVQGYDEFDDAGRVSYDERDIELGPGLMNILEPGEDIKSADPKRPTSGFEAFTRAISAQIGAALEVPADLLNKTFNSSYSASRAALLEAWKAFKMRRTWFVADFCQPAYEAWFAEAVARERIPAPGFFDDPLKRAAWLGAEWTGPSQGQLDPTKEVTAHILAIDNGLETREQATIALNGGNVDANLQQLARENAIMAELSVSGKEADDGSEEPQDGDETEQE